MNGQVIMLSNMAILSLEDTLLPPTSIQTCSLQTKKPVPTLTKTWNPSKSMLQKEDGSKSSTTQTQIPSQETELQSIQVFLFGINMLNRVSSTNTSLSLQELPLTTLLTLDPGTLKVMMPKNTS
jgi:hypothetical protein